MGTEKALRRTRTGRAASVQANAKLLKQQIRAALRKVWSRFSIEKEHVLYLSRSEWTTVNKDGSSSKKKRILYMCSLCRACYKITEVQVDHIIPVGSTPESIFDSIAWGEWVHKLFCDYTNLQVLCKPCHVKKTKQERRANARKV